MGPETLFACAESGKGKAIVTDGFDPLVPAWVTGGVNDTGGRSNGIGPEGGLNLAVAGEMRTAERWFAFGQSIINI